MNRKMISLFFAAVILLAVLAGCGAAPQSTDAVETKVPETTEAAAPVDTRRAAEYTFLDKLGLKLWDGFNLLDSEDIETHGKEIFSNMGAEILYFNSETYSAQSYVDKAIADAMLDVQVLEFVSGELEESFYQLELAEDPDLTEEEWLAEHKNDKLLYFSGETTFFTATQNAAYYTNHNWSDRYSVYWQWPLIVDAYTGLTYHPQTGSEKVAEKFTLGNGRDTFYAMYDGFSGWEDVPGSSYQNLVKYHYIWALVPADYDGLVFALELYEENRTDDAIRALYDNQKSTSTDNTSKEEDTSTWWQGDFYFENDYLKRFYFAPVEQ